MICVTFALPEESTVLRSVLHNSWFLERGRLPVLTGTISEREVVVGHTGVGFDSCRFHLEKILASEKPRLLITSGFAGGLTPALQQGDVVLSENFSDPLLVQRAQQNLRDERRVFWGRTTSQPVIAETVEQKMDLARQTKALAVDMESAVIREICAASEIPMLSVRGISDAHAVSLPVPFTVWFDLHSQQPRRFALAAYLIRNWHCIRPFARFATQIVHTRAHLTRCLLKVIKGV
jgi:adenosylhomocysteine nucleosidase